MYNELKEISLSDYPQLKAELEKMNDWQRQHFSWGQKYLEYIGRNKSEHTYTRFSNETERFLLWTILIKDKPIDTFKKSDVLD